jgi:predicted DNA-binding protein
MSDQDMNQPGRASHKTLAIRLDPELHAQLSIIAQLSGSTITDEIREAITAHVETKRSAPDLAGKASAVLDDIERDADVRRSAITALFGSDDGGVKPARPRGKQRATGGEDSPTS